LKNRTEKIVEEQTLKSALAFLRSAKKTASLNKRRKPITEKQRAALKLHAYKPGQSGNPGGRPKYDVAAAIARAIFEQNEELVYNAFVRALSQGNAYTFDILANRGFGKITDKLEVSTDQELTQKLLDGRKRAAERNKKK
jgi:hypothetical protein